MLFVNDYQLLIKKSKAEVKKKKQLIIILQTA